MCKDFVRGHGVDFAAGVEAFFDQLFQKAARHLVGELVGDHLACQRLITALGLQRQASSSPLQSVQKRDDESANAFEAHGFIYGLIQLLEE